ncbi:MAG: GNAT family acetyltransferase [Candidatus Roizmanbacteria bacterium GW2011_GWA2_32_13]|uniref:GNAT family acetyltransferase n=1 Tax=Candidatus Roizmanbacteria bacterium GW2011_GWA2_32_13 TaxID=1618475 RepID=A0A0F9YLW0_9BACT|nr:MAG: GNAT family acetyltransferase [Candidatus Roizmanbacteria bacterium GW2011_GWA2_32_13]
MALNIRLFSTNNAKELSKMIFLVINELEKENPTLVYQLVRDEDQPDELIKAAEKGKMWVAFENNIIVGTLSLEDKRLRRFFVHPNYQRQGIGRKLINIVIQHIKKNYIMEIWVGAIMSAVPIYEKLGFKKVRQFFNKEINQDEMEMKFSLNLKKN